ncbi:MAG: hypothetical protein ACD_56C00084G0001 [uncultured bacterium]|nr:MAG: hypothetical protein ACD_56C00084G0001 [uncultured bacterium]
MNNKLIIISTISFMLISFVFLSWSERKQADINTKNIWMIYFENPTDNSLNFKIENHSTNTDFNWQLLAEKKIIREESAAIETGETSTIPVSMLPINTANKKTSVIVTAGEEKKEIYKILK